MNDQLTSPSCVYIGLGHMGRPVFDATYRYFLRNGWRVFATDIDSEKLAGLPVETAPRVPSHATLAIVGVRPQDFQALRDEACIADVVVSMMAGISCASLHAAFPAAQVIRMIPNTPCAHGAGLTPIHIAPRAEPAPRLGEILTGLGCLGPLLHVPSNDQPNYYYLGLGRILALPPSTEVFMPNDAGLFFWETLHHAFADHLSPETRALDLGCGSGLVAMGLALSGCRHLTASDVNPAHVAYAREHFARNVPVDVHARFVVSDLYDSLGDARYDLIAFNCPGWATPSDEFAPALRAASGAQYGSMFEGDRIAKRSIEEGLRRLQRGGSIVLGLNSIGNVAAVLAGTRLASGREFGLRLLGKREFPLLLYNDGWRSHRRLLEAQLEAWRHAGVSFFRRDGDRIVWTYEIVCVTDLGDGVDA